MSESKRGVVMLLQAGDTEITGAIAEGILAARSARAEALTPEQIGTVEAEIDRQEIERALLRVAVGNSKTAEDYAMMRFEADVEYGESLIEPGWWNRIADKALGIYGLFVCAVAGAFRAQDRVLGG